MCASQFARVSMVVVIACGAAAGQTTSLASAGIGGAQANDGSNSAAISADGRFVAFESRASNLVAGDTNNASDVFVRDRIDGTIERVSVDSAGAQGDSWSYVPTISADGRCVAFLSQASNLVAGDTNGKADIFVHDRVSGTTERVSVASDGTQASELSQYSSISGDGRFVTFSSLSTNLVAGDTNDEADVFLRDRSNGTTERVSVSSSGAQANLHSSRSSISPDGRFVAFESYASTLVPGNAGGASIFVRDRTLGTTERVSLNSAGVKAIGVCWEPSISADGRFVAFYSLASNLVAGDTNGYADIFVRDRLSATTERVSVDSAGAQADLDSIDPSISADGCFVTFRSVATNLVAGDTNGEIDIFVRDRINQTTERASVDTDGAEGNGDCLNPEISADGRIVAFVSDASNLVAGDTNGWRDVFVRDREPQPADAYCTAGTTSSGCTASIHGSANPSVSQANACNITVAGVEGQKSGLLFYGVDNTGFTPPPWAPASTSYLCVKPPTQRTPIQNSGGTAGSCNGSYALDWNAYQSANPLALGDPWSAGAKVYAQAWFRDPPAVKSTNLSSAVEMTYVP